MDNGGYGFRAVNPTASSVAVTTAIPRNNGFHSTGGGGFPRQQWVFHGGGGGWFPGGRATAATSLIKPERPESFPGQRSENFAPKNRAGSHRPPFHFTSSPPPKL